MTEYSIQLFSFFVSIKSISLPQSEREEQTKYLFVTVGLWVYPSPLSAAKRHPSLELPQTHLQKIRHEIVWLLHHRGHLPPPPQPTASSRAFPPAVLWGAVSLRQLQWAPSLCERAPGNSSSRLSLKKNTQKFTSV